MTVPRIRLVLHGHLSCLAGQSVFDIDVREGETVSDVLARWQAQNSSNALIVMDTRGRLQDGMLVAVDNTLTGLDLNLPLRDGQVIDLISELAGG